jgi:hypothetical protein
LLSNSEFERKRRDVPGPLILHPEGMAANVDGKAVLAALEELPSDAPTACERWTAHDLAAHLAAGSKEVADGVEAKLAGQPDRPTRGLAEREAPFRAMAYDDVLARLVAESKRKLAAYDSLASNGDDTISLLPQPELTTSPDCRLLALWGRRSAEFDGVVEGDPALVAALDDIVSPKATQWSVA